MGNSGSAEEAESVGYRVLGVQPNSPAAKGGLVSFFDFIVAANGVPLKCLDGTFIELIQASEDKPLPLTVYNWKCGAFREVTLVPTRNWPGEGMLGVTIRFDTYHNAEEHLCHILDVEANSPAELAGLQPEKDYLLGTAEKVFKDTDVLFEELKQNLEHPIEFYVYNADTDEVRVVILMPSTEWGGEGILGAGVAHGYLHGLPSHCCKTIGISHEGTLNAASNIEAPQMNSNHNPLSQEAIFYGTSEGRAAVNSSGPPLSQESLDSPTKVPSVSQGTE